MTQLDTFPRVAISPYIFFIPNRGKTKNRESKVFQFVMSECDWWSHTEQHSCGWPIIGIPIPGKTVVFIETQSCLRLQYALRNRHILRPSLSFVVFWCRSIFHDHFTATKVILQLPQCQWSNLEVYRYIWIIWTARDSLANHNQRN